MVIGACALLSFVSVWFAMASREVIDTATGAVQGNLWYSCARLFLLLGLQVVLQIAINLLEVRMSGQLEMRMKENLFYSLLKKDWQTISSFHSGELMNRLTSDVTVIVSGLTTILPDFVSLVVRIIASFSVLVMLSPKLALCIIAVGPIVFVLARIYSKRMKSLHKACQQSDGATRSFMQEMLQNLIVVKSFQNEKAVSDHANEFQIKNYLLKLKRNAITLLANVFLFLAFTGCYYVVLAWGAFQLGKGLTFGTLTAMLQLVSQIQTPFRSLSGLLSKCFSVLASAERIMELEQLSPERAYLPDVIRVEDFSSLQVKNVSFDYDHHTVLDGADFSLQQGEFVAIAGQSGIGKSTLLKLMIGLIRPQQGSLYLQGAKGQVDMDETTRGYFAYVPQGNMIVSGTIRDNICFYKTDVSEEQIRFCASVAEMDEYLKTLPDGLDTVLQEGGAGLSEGQIQRIAIARALLRDAPVLLLDEATSALDEKTEEKVLSNIRSLTKKSCVIVSHKKAAFSICDRVMRIENGKMMEVKEEWI